MRLGVHLGYWGLGVSAEDQLGLAHAAERLGYDCAWVAEAYGSDAASVLGWLAHATTTIGLGAGIFQLPGRSPAMTAMTAATLDQLSNGRMRLGLGASGPQVAEGWHGQPFAGQLTRTREYVEVVRMALERRRVELHGRAIDVPLPGAAGKALKLMIAPVQQRLPIYLAALGPHNTALAGEIADGWIPTLLWPERAGELRAALQRGADRAGRSLEGFDVAALINLRIDQDLERARDALRPLLALYIGGMGSREHNFYNRLVAGYGFERAARQVQDLYLDGRQQEAAAALPAELIDAVTLCGPPARVRERLAAHRAAGVTTLVVSPIAEDAERRVAQLTALVELAA